MEEITLPVFYEEREIVIPGDLLAEDNYVGGDNTYEENGKIYSTRVGLVSYEKQKVKVVALRSFYVPQTGDMVIGKVVGISQGGWMVDVKAPYLAMLRASDVLNRTFRPQRDDLPSIFDIDDCIIAEVIAYDRTRGPLLTVREQGLGKITRGKIIEVTPTKIPRIIGRNGSMISMLMRETACQITVAQNGLILVNGKTPGDERLSVMAIRKIEDEAHLSGLTDRVEEMIKREKEGDLRA